MESGGSSINIDLRYKANGCIDYDTYWKLVFPDFNHCVSVATQSKYRWLRTTSTDILGDPPVLSDRYGIDAFK